MVIETGSMVIETGLSGNKNFLLFNIVNLRFSIKILLQKSFIPS